MVGLLAAGLLSGCTEGSLADLESFVQETLARPGKRPEELPPIEPYVTYFYPCQIDTCSDPFKPFYVEELVARLRTVVRRAAGEAAHIVKVADLQMDLVQHSVRRGDEEIALSMREFSLLEFLMHSPGRVMTRTQICEHVWNYGFDPETNLVDVYIQRLRKKIDRDHGLKLIETVRGVGYRIAKPD